jgi:hypothetical protein
VSEHVARHEVRREEQKREEDEPARLRGRCAARLQRDQLIGLGSNALFGWWWADPAVALVIAAVAVREGQKSWRGEDSCCALPAAACEDDCCA